MYVGQNYPNSAVYALNSKGGVKNWNARPGALFTGLVLAADGFVYAGTRNGILYVINEKTGALDVESRLKTEKSRTGLSSPVISTEGTIYCGSGNKVVAIRPGSPGPAAGPWPMFGRDARHTGRAVPLSD